MFVAEPPVEIINSVLMKSICGAEVFHCRDIRTDQGDIHREFYWPSCLGWSPQYHAGFQDQTRAEIRQWLLVLKRCVGHFPLEMTFAVCEYIAGFQIIDLKRINHQQNLAEEIAVRKKHAYKVHKDDGK